jgi:hypothetical protein
MLRKGAALLIFLALAAGAWGQGLNLPPGVTKDDWEEINFEFNSSVLVDGFPSLLRLAELLQQNPGFKSVASYAPSELSAPIPCAANARPSTQHERPP